MSESITLLLANRAQAWGAMERQLFPWLKQALQAERRWTLTVRPEKRSDEQNRLLHARINDVANQCEWAGRRWDAESWKRLLTAAWCRTRNQGAELVPAIDGKGFDVLYHRTSQLSRAECSDLCEFIMSWGSSLDTPVRWSVASLGGEIE